MLEGHTVIDRHAQRAVRVFLDGRSVDGFGRETLSLRHAFALPLNRLFHHECLWIDALRHSGLIAEEVAEVYPDLVAYEPDSKPDTVK